jgi:hypothetical protein
MMCSFWAVQESGGPTRRKLIQRKLQMPVIMAFFERPFQTRSSKPSTVESAVVTVLWYGPLHCHIRVHNFMGGRHAPFAQVFSSSRYCFALLWGNGGNNA